jgi:hypothetical protein
MKAWALAFALAVLNNIAHLLAVPAREKYMYIAFSPHILRIVYEVLLGIVSFILFGNFME